MAQALCQEQCLVLVRDLCHLGWPMPGRGGGCRHGWCEWRGQSDPHLCVILLTGLSGIVEGSVAVLRPEGVVGRQDKVLGGGQPVHLVMLHLRQLCRHLLVVAGERGRGGWH